MRNRRALSLLITLMMIVSMFAGTGLSAALAESTIRGVVQINTLDELKQALKSQNNTTLQLMNDIIGDGKSETCKVDGKTLTLDLNGHTLNANNYHSAIWTTGKANVTIVDSAGGGKIIGGNATRGGGINIGDNCVVTLEGGTITDNKASDQGGGVYVYGKGTFNMTGGVIEKNTASNQGGGIYNAGTVTANGGTLRLNATSNGGGGAIFNNGTLTMTDSTLSRNTAATRGGAILNEKGKTLTLTDCVVADNYAKGIDGGGIVNYGTLNVTGGAFTNNESWSSGGGIFLTQDSMATITGATFTGNVANEKGGAIMVRPNASCTLEDVTITENRAMEYGGGIDVENKPKAFNIKGTIVVKDNECSDKMGKDVYLGNTVTITQTGALTEGSQIGVHVSGNQNYAFVNGFTTYNKGEKPAKYYTAQEGFWVMSGENGGEPYVWNSTWKAAQELIDDAPDGGTIVLERDYAGNEADKYLSVTKNITIDLNGHTLNRGLKAIQSNGSAILVGAGGTLTIRDSAGGGKITGGAANDGGGIEMIAGTVNLEGGAITGNLANQGAGVYNNSRYGSLNISGGEITGNRANKIGGGVYIADGKSVNLTGGKITGNRAQEGGGVYSNAKSGGLSVQGAPVVNDNYAPSGNNIKLKNGAKIAVAGRLEDGALLDVSAEKTDSVLTSGLQDSGSSLDAFTYNGNRGSAKPSLKDGELFINLDVKADVWVSDWDGLQKAVNNATNGQVIALSQNIKSGSAGRIWVGGKTITIDLNGYAIEREVNGQTITSMGKGFKPVTYELGDKNGHVIEIQERGNLTIKDSVGTGVIKGGFAQRGGGIHVGANCTLNFEGGTITGNRANAGGGIYARGILNLKGGVISGNYAEGGGGIATSDGGWVSSSGDPVIVDNSAEKGAGIYNEGTVKLNGGRIESNQSTVYGGAGLENHGTAELTGVTFKGNTAVGRGGAIFSDEDTSLTVTGCVFEGNSTERSGGAIYTNSDLSVTGGEFYANTAKGNGGAINSEEDTTTTINSGTFTGNKAGRYGGAMLIGNDTALNLYGGTFTGNSGYVGGGIVIWEEDSTLRVKGSVVVRDNTASKYGHNLYLMAEDESGDSLHDDLGSIMHVDGKLNPDTDICVGLGTYSGVYTTGYSKYHQGEEPDLYFSAEEGNAVRLKGNEVELINTDWIDLQRQITRAEDGATITLERSWSGDAKDEPLTIPAGKTVTIDLNGQRLVRTGKSISDKNSVIVVESGATLTIKDSSGKNGGQITGGMAKEGGAIRNMGTLRLEGGTLTGNTSRLGGAVSNVSDDGKAVFEMTGGVIKGNTSEQGGAIASNGTLRLTGGSITNNTASRSHGGALYLTGGEAELADIAIIGNTALKGSGGGIYFNDASVKLNNVKLTGNKAALQGGGAFYGESATLGVEGATVVYNNTAATGHNIMMASGNVLRVTGGLTDAARVDLTSPVDTEATLTEGLEANGGNAERFTYNNTTGKAVLAGGELYVNMEVEADVWASDWKGLQDAVNKSTSGQVIALAADVTGNGSQSIKFDGKTVVLDLNGHTINGKGNDDNSVLWVTGKSTLTIRDSKGTGTVTGGRAERGGAINVGDKATVNIEGGTYSGNRATEHGAAFYVYGTLNMTGGTISGNTSSHRAGAIYVAGSGKANLSNVVIRSNTGDHAGAIFVDGTLNAENVRFEDNVSVNYGGGAIYCQGGSTSLTSCVFTGNQCKDYGGAVFVQQGRTVNLTDCTITGNTGKFGGGVFVKGTANLNGGRITGNTASSSGGGIRVDGSDYPTLNIEGSLVVKNNEATTGNNVYLPRDHYITFSGPMTKGAQVDVSLRDDWGVFAKDYSTHNSDDPATFFTSVEGYTVSLANGEPYMGETAQTLEKGGARSVSANGVSSRNWMSGIPDERRLNEINIPGTHDSAMYRLRYSLFGSGLQKWAVWYQKNAQTQYRYINQQMDEGFRIFDLRLNNEYEELGLFNIVTGYDDDGVNLWLCHGQVSAAGTSWAEDPNGNRLSFAEVLGWVKTFLQKHPTEVIILNLAAETTDSDDKPIIEKRIAKIMRAFAREINPATGKPYLWTVDGDISKSAPGYPTLGEVRGQVLIKGGATGKNGLGNTCQGAGTVTSRKAGGTYQYGSESKIRFLTSFFSAYGNIQLPRNVYEHLDVMYDNGTNCAPAGLAGIPTSTPLENVEDVNPAIFGKGGVVDRNGYYIGWFTMDGGTAAEAATVWRTNFFPMDYVTVTVEGGLTEEQLASGNFEPVALEELELLNTPEETEDGEQPAEEPAETEAADEPDTGVRTYRVMKGKTITVPQSMYEYDPNVTEREFQGWQVVSETANAIAYPGEELVLMEDTTLTGHWLGTSETSVEVRWQDADNADEFRPESIEIKVSVDENPENDYTVTVNAEDGWKTVVTGDVTAVRPVWERIDEASEQGEDTEEGYRYEVGLATDLLAEDEAIVGESDALNRALVITLFHTPRRTIDASGVIEWNDDDNRDGIRPDSVTLHLFNGEEEIDSITTTAEEGWAWSFGELPEFIDAQAVTYTITEDVIVGYENNVSALTVTNSHTPEVTDISGGIVWADNDNAQGIRPENVTVRLLADGEPIAAVNVTVEGGNTTVMEITRTYDEATEADVNAQAEAEAEDGSEYEGTFEAPEAADESNADVVDEELVTAEVPVPEGVEQPTEEEMRAVSEWNWSFINVPVYGNGGQRINYTLVEDTPAGYFDTLSTEGGNLFTNALAPAQYTINFDANGGEGEMEGQQADPGTEITLPENGFTAPEGMEFAGWTVDIVKPEIEESTVADQIMAELNGQGEAEPEGEPVEETVEEPAEAPAEEAEQATEATGEAEEEAYLQPGDVFVLSGNATVTAQWQEAPQPIVITFDANGGEGEMEAAQPNEEGDYTLPECGFTAPEGMEFAGWTVKVEQPQPTEDTGIEAEEETVVEDMIPEETEEYVETIYSVGDEINLTASATVIAQWQEPAQPVTVTFDGNGAEGEMEALTPDETGMVLLPDNGFTVPEGMEFAGWTLVEEAPETDEAIEVETEAEEATADEAGRVFGAGDSIVVTVNTTAVAQWQEIPATATITFYANGGEGEMEPATPDEDGTYTLPENGFTAPEGKEFIGWQIGEETWQVGDEITVNEDITVLAVWLDPETPQPISVTVTFRVVNGLWDDDKTNEDRVVTLEGIEGDELILRYEDIPYVGGSPDEGYDLGAWDVEPSLREAISEDVTYTYAYEELDGTSAVVAVEDTEEETTAEEPAEEVVEEPTEEQPAEETAEEPTEEQPTEETVEEPTEEQPTEETVEEPTEEQPTEEAVEEPTEEQPTEETVDEPTEEQPTEETVEEPTEEQPTEETVEEPTEEQLTEEAVEEPTEEQPAEETVEEPTEEQPTEEQPTEEQPTEEQPTDIPADAEMITVTFESGGADGEMQPMNVAASSELTLPESEYYLDGLAFAGWEIDGAAYQPGDTVVVSGDTVVNAMWTVTDDEGALEYGEEEVEFGDDGTEEAPAEEDNGLDVEVEEVEAEDAEAVAENTPSEAGTAVSGTGIAAIVTAAVLAIAAALFAILKKKKK